MNEASLALTQALRHVMRARVQDAHLSRELQEVTAAAALVDMAKELEFRTVLAARGVSVREGQRAVVTATGAILGQTRRSWAQIGAALGMSPQSAHERWARRIASWPAERATDSGPGPGRRPPGS